MFINFIQVTWLTLAFTLSSDALLSHKKPDGSTHKGLAKMQCVGKITDDCRKIDKVRQRSENSMAKMAGDVMSGELDCNDLVDNHDTWTFYVSLDDNSTEMTASRTSFSQSAGGYQIWCGQDIIDSKTSVCASWRNDIVDRQCDAKLFHLTITQHRMDGSEMQWTTLPASTVLYTTTSVSSELVLYQVQMEYAPESENEVEVVDATAESETTAASTEANATPIVAADVLTSADCSNDATIYLDVMVVFTAQVETELSGRDQTMGRIAAAYA